LANSNTPLAGSKKGIIQLKEHIVEIISDSGEGAQKCGQSLGSIAAQMGNGIWTTEIIPAEIRPPARSIAGASGRTNLGGDNLCCPDTISHLGGNRSKRLSAFLCSFSGITYDFDNMLF
jgi:hypothetical protein